MKDRHKFLSLGAGVQSSTIFLMSCLGFIEKIDAAIFADTGWEPKKVYEWLKFLISMGEKHGIPVHIVSVGNIKEDALISQVRGHRHDGHRWASMPYFTKVWIDGHYEIAHGEEQLGMWGDHWVEEWIPPRWSNGMIRRQCTSEYKIRPIEKKQRELAGFKPYQRIPPGTVETWKGISTDEIKRASISSVRWIDFYYPLIEMGFSRQTCIEWCHQRGFKPPRSACIGCPYHSKAEWRDMRDNYPDEWQEAVEFDRAIRNCGGMRGQVFLHADRIPLDEVDLSTPDDFQKHMSLFRDECQGICGV